MGDDPHPGAGQAAQGQPEPLRVSGTDDDPLGVGGGRAHPAQIAGQHLAQHPAPARIAVVEVRGRHGAARLAQCPEPVGDREAAQVGDAVPEVGDEPRGRRSRGGGHGRDVGTGGDPGGGAGPGHQVSLGLELGVAVLHEAARQPEFAGEFTGGGEAFVRVETAGADRVAQLSLQLGAQLLATVPVDGQEQLG